MSLPSYKVGVTPGGLVGIAAKRRKALGKWGAGAFAREKHDSFGLLEKKGSIQIDHKRKL